MRTANINKIGETNYNTYGSKMTIIKYIKTNDIIVQFENGYETKTNYNQFKKGIVKNPYDKSVFGVGYLGEGKYKPNFNKQVSKQYVIWMKMLERCYDPKYQEKHSTYKDCLVCEQWHNFQNFAKWYDENYYEIDDKTMCLNKNILVKGNKIYSPETVIFVPQNINKLFCKANKKRGDLPIGVTFHKRSGKYQASCNDNNNKQEFLGYYNTAIECFNSYKTFKENLIKKIANKYKYIISEKIYEAMYRYEVEITD